MNEATTPATNFQPDKKYVCLSTKLSHSPLSRRNLKGKMKMGDVPRSMERVIVLFPSEKRAGLGNLGAAVVDDPSWRSLT